MTTRTSTPIPNTWSWQWLIPFAFFNILSGITCEALTKLTGLKAFAEAQPVFNGFLIGNMTIIQDILLRTGFWLGVPWTNIGIVAIPKVYDDVCYHPAARDWPCERERWVKWFEGRAGLDSYYLRVFREQLPVLVAAAGAWILVNVLWRRYTGGPAKVGDGNLQKREEEAGVKGG